MFQENVLIEPLWDGNEGIAIHVDRGGGVLIEPLWDGNDAQYNAGVWLINVLIEPLWDGNEDLPDRICILGLSLNRTIVGWKLKIAGYRGVIPSES
ncbi:hypothetical protein JDF658_01160 [Carboxydocella sp. JDF658]|nr:hypothetical protein JDF658_01160 [Carboxydocella sp. JDF658]